MPLKIRYRAPSGPGTLDLDDNATVEQLFTALKDKTGHSKIGIKYGWPPKSLQADHGSESVVALNLQRESLTVTAERPISPPLPVAPSANPVVDAPKRVEDQNVTVPLPPPLGGFLVLRVMPNDNSCMFTAVGGALRAATGDPALTSPERLRRTVVDYIKNHPETYTELVLEKPPEKYCRQMLQPDVWGGAIELGILSEVFNIEICVVNVKAGGVIKYGEGKYDRRCILCWSNIHYDRVAQIFSEEQAEVDFDVTTWDTASSDNVLESALALCKRLKEEFHYFTDTSDFLLKCRDCTRQGKQWIGQGQDSAVDHIKATGHDDLVEIKDVN